MRFEIQTKAVDVCFVTTDEQSGKSCFVHSLLPIESSVSSLVFKGEKPNRERKCAVKFKIEFEHFIFHPNQIYNKYSTKINSQNSHIA